MLTSKAFSDIITFSRSSNATRIGPTGRVEYAPHNLLARSEEFDNAYWSKDQSSIVANSVAAPNGTITADKVVEDTALQTHGIYRLGLTVTSGLTYTWSVYAKKAERNWIILSAGGGANNSAWFNLNTGAAGTIQSGVAAATITSVGNDWYRCSVTRTVSSGSANFECYASTADNTSSYTGDGTSGVYLWGAQLSVGPYPLDYTPTTSAAVYGPRFDYDPVTLAARGLLVEESRTNLVTYSEQFDNAAWAAQAVTVTANTGVAPDGTTTADKIAADNTSFPHALYNASPLTLTATIYTWSIFVKAAGNNFANLTAVSPNGGNRYAIAVDLTNGTVTQTASSGTPTNTSNFVSNYGNGWYRIGISMTAASSSNSYFVVMGIPTGTPTRDSSSLDPQYTGDGTSGIYIWGAQLEAGSFATSYIPTPTNSTVTRSADVASVNTLSPWYSSTEGTLFVEANSIGNVAYPGIAWLAGTGYRAIGFYYGPNATESGFEVGDVSGQVGIGLTALAKPAYNKFAGAYKANDFAAVVNGGAVGTDTSGTIPTVSSLIIGALYNGTAQLNGTIKRIAYYPRRLTNAELQALTA